MRPGTRKWDRTYFDEPSRWKYAARILDKHPDVSGHSIHTAAASGNAGAVERFVASHPESVSEKGGPQGWQPLQYVCYGRLPVAAFAENSVAIARRLIDAGADVAALLPYEGCSFLPLTGAIGEGEMSQPRHPQAVALAELLIERGADPYEPQALYNTSLEQDDTIWLDFLYERSARRNETFKWTAPSSTWPNSGMLNYLLGNAVSRNDLADETNFRPLHAAAGADAVEVGKLLIERGAEIDPVETRFDGVPLGWALHGKRPRMIAMLGALSRTPRALVSMGNVARLRELFAEDSALARLTNRNGSLFCYLPDDEDLAIEIAELLLSYGADPNVKNHEGQNAMECLERCGLDEVAEILGSR
ncbi:MAG TPA: ankyrin repeat domain-containing protein [Gammaproteobacteria bacterium]|nr:ankyrin repeat domain-containing protein [Gammaproteobacteria bacterium]